MINYPRKSWAQLAEDLVTQNNLHFFGLDLHNITYLDIGTNDPRESNNTYLFYENGSRGVLVEPDKMYWDRIITHRPHDKLIKACVADFNADEADFYVLTAHSLNTLVKTTAEHSCSQAGYGNQKIEVIVKTPVIEVNKLLSENFIAWPNFISIDVEGMDFSIIKAIDWKKYKVEVVCVEVNEFRNNIMEIMFANDYHIVCDNGLNLIFARNQSV